MAFPQVRSVEVAPRSKAPTRLISEDDAPVASPVHALQNSLNQLVVPSRSGQGPIDVRATAIRITLYVVTPLALWTGIAHLAF